MNSGQPLILISNDDSIKAPGIRALIGFARSFGKVVVVAPDRPQSGTAHAVTINTPLRLELLSREENYEEYSCSGTPADCVKLAHKVVLKRKPDLLLSGINHGSNASINIIYSGTMAAVFEGAMAGVPSVGFSLCDYRWDADFRPAEKIVKHVISEVLENGLPDGVCLNVNIPAANGHIRGVKVCRQAGGTWLEEFDERKDPAGRDYYWLHGVFARIGNGEDTDERALEQGYASVVPVQFDFTASHAIPKISTINKDF